jgi:hypothetical protein
MKASSGALLAVMAVAALATTALAKNYTVDDSIGWDTYVNYDKWTAGKTFMVGDNIGNPSITLYRHSYGLRVFFSTVVCNTLRASIQIWQSSSTTCTTPCWR